MERREYTHTLPMVCDMFGSRSTTWSRRVAVRSRAQAEWNANANANWTGQDRRCSHESFTSCGGWDGLDNVGDGVSIYSLGETSSSADEDWIEKLPPSSAELDFDFQSFSPLLRTHRCHEAPILFPSTSNSSLLSFLSALGSMDQA